MFAERVLCATLRRMDGLGVAESFGRSRLREVRQLAERVGLPVITDPGHVLPVSGENVARYGLDPCAALR